MSFDYETPLVRNLMMLGVKKSFTSDAEFPNIINGTQLKIGGANHRAAINISERGTEAAAVTEITMLGDIATPEPPEIIYFHADRPYIFVIRNEETDITLFVGAVNRFY